MPRWFVVACVVLGFLSFIGCRKEDDAADNAAGTSAVPPPAQPTAPPAAANTPEGKVRSLLEQLQKQSYEHKWNEADATVQQLESLKASVTQDLRDEIDNARGSLNAAKEIAKQSGER
jgi:hypothetical protein